MAEPSCSGMAIRTRTFYGRSSKNKAQSPRDILSCMPSGDESDFGDLSDDGDTEYVLDTRSTPPDPAEPSGDDSSDDEMDSSSGSHCGTGSIDRGHWRRNLLDCAIPTFSEAFTMPVTIEPALTYFRKFISTEMITSLAEETNLYSTQSTGHSLNVTEAELEQYIGIYLMMGLVQMPSVRCYWENGTRFPVVADVMPRNRFEKLMRLIHFTDNHQATEDTKRDKAWKIRTWLNSLQENLQSVEQEELNSVDEMMISFTGRCPMKQYMPAKPNPWGIKLWGRAGSSGFLYQFDVYQGQAKQHYLFGLGGDVTLRMCEFLPQQKGYKIAADNYFTSLDLATELSKRGLGFVGTIRRNRLKDCRLKSENDLKKEGRGAFDYAVDNLKNIAVVRWYDNRAVTLVSNYVSAEPVGTVRRWDKKEKKFIQVPQPGIVATYNRFMGGVDLLNYLIELYMFPIKSRRWYLYLFYHSLMIDTVNAWLLYRRHCSQLNEKPVNLRRFQASIAESLIAVRKKPVKRPTSSVTPPVKKRKVGGSAPQDDVRLDGVGHMPIWGSSRLRCKSCPPAQNSFSYTYCCKCNVNLCYTKDRNCFVAYHM
ncbi:piggyBac transposable element-derived protein 3-like [Ixodes scapularis]